MNNVTKIIFDTLARRQSIVLPGAGSLEVKRRKAKKISDTRIIPPMNVVLFKREEVSEAESLIYLISSINGVGEDEARGIYDTWLNEAQNGEDWNLGEAGNIINGHFEISPELQEALNPGGTEEIVTMKKRKDSGGPLWMWILAGVLLAVLVLVLFFCFGGKSKTKIKTPAAIEQVAPPVVEPFVEPVVEPKPVVAAPVHRFHIIVGSFEIESNADDFVTQMKKELPGQSVEKVRNRFNNNWLVSVFNAPTEREAYNRMERFWDIEPDIWVYEEK